MSSAEFTEYIAADHLGLVPDPAADPWDIIRAIYEGSPNEFRQYPKERPREQPPQSIEQAQRNVELGKNCGNTNRPSFNRR